MQPLKTCQFPGTAILSERIDLRCCFRYMLPMSYASVLLALADPTRRTILRRLRRGPRTVQDIADGMPVSRPAVSQHLQVLKGAGLVRSRADGTRRIYTLDERGFAALRAWLERFLEEREEAPAVASPEPAAAASTALPTVPGPLRKSVRVPRSVLQAFQLYTQGIATWWPLLTHSLNGANAASCTIEGRIGGRVFERSKFGRPLIWGTVLTWEPPRRLVFTWHPGRDPATAQEIEVTFHDAGGGATIVETEHRGWERLGEEAAAIRQDYDRGWDHVLGECYSKAAQARR